MILVLLSGLLGGCSTAKQAYLEETLDLGYVQRVAILPLENHTSEKFAAERLRDVFTTELLSQRIFDVVEKGDLNHFLREEVSEAESYNLDAALARRLGQALSIEAYLAGSVDDYTEMRNGSYSYPVVAVTLRLVDVKTGRIIWQASGSTSGYSTWGRVFGFASDSVNEVSFRLAKDLLKTLR